jgi:hypothetical protein
VSSFFDLITGVRDHYVKTIRNNAEKGQKCAQGWQKMASWRFSAIYGAVVLRESGQRRRKKGCFLQNSAIFVNNFLSGFRQNRAYFRFCGMGGPAF